MHYAYCAQHIDEITQLVNIDYTLFSVSFWLSNESLYKDASSVNSTVSTVFIMIYDLTSGYKQCFSDQGNFIWAFETRFTGGRIL